MTDVIQIAQERRAQLRAELQKIEDFLRMAEMLTRDGTSPADVAPMSDHGSADNADKAGGPSALRTNLFRQSGTAG